MKLNCSFITNLFCADDGQEMKNDEGPESNPQYTTVYVGNLAPEASVSSVNFIINYPVSCQWTRNAYFNVELEHIFHFFGSKDEDGPLKQNDL